MQREFCYLKRAFVFAIIIIILYIRRVGNTMQLEFYVLVLFVGLGVIRRLFFMFICVCVYVFILSRMKMNQNDTQRNRSERFGKLTMAPFPSVDKTEEESTNKIL